MDRSESSVTTSALIAQPEAATGNRLGQTRRYHTFVLMHLIQTDRDLGSVRLDSVELVEAYLTGLIGESMIQFIEKSLQQLMQPATVTPTQQSIEQFQQMHQHVEVAEAAVRSIHNQVFSSAGTGTELEKVQVTLQRVVRVVRVVEDILMHGMGSTGISELCDAWRKGELLYQKCADVVPIM